MIISANKWEHDVQGYLNICNITDSTPRKQLRDFAAGVNDLGLWNNMVCWPLRSTQNAGTGTTAYSLGGLGTFNGTLTNGPTWGGDGLDINAASSHSVTVNPSPFTDFANGHSVFSVFNPTGPNPSSSTSALQWVLTHSANLARFGQLGTGSTNSVVTTYQKSVGIAVSGNAAYSLYKDRFGFYGYNASASEVTYKSFGGTMAHSAVAAFNATLSGGLSITATQDGRNTLALLMVTTPQFNLSGSLQTSLESLYKSTLGIGLSLP